MVDYIKVFSKDRKTTKYFFYIVERISEVRNDFSREWALESIQNTEFQKLESDINLSLSKLLSTELNSEELDRFASLCNYAFSILENESCQTRKK